MIFTELRQVWRIGCKIVVLVGVALSFFAVMEVVRAYLTLRELHWLLGAGFLVIIAGLLLWGLHYFLSAMRSYPKVLKPAPRSRVRKYAKYLAGYLDRLAVNDALSEDEKVRAAADHKKIRSALRNLKGSAVLLETIEQVEAETIGPLLKTLDKQADKNIRAATRDIMFAVTVSPYRSLDVIVVIYRNMAMVKNIASVYNARPALRESLRIAYDTARVVAAVNFVNLGSKMLENITKGLPGMIPGVNRIIDDCTQGLAAGLLTSVTGHAARDRCRAFGQWDYELAKRNIANHLKTFSADVGKMFFKDIVPHIKIPGQLAVDKWKDIRDGVVKGFNETVQVVQSFTRFRTGTEKKHPK